MPLPLSSAYKCLTADFVTAEATDSRDFIMDPVLGRPAWTIETEQIRVSVTECGAHVAEIVLKHCDEVNPLWIQNRPSIDSDQFDPAIHGTTYGTGYEARLISGLVGHNLYFPFWGNPSAHEAPRRDDRPR